MDEADAIAAEVRLAQDWYRQGKDDGVQIERERIVFWLRKEGMETEAWRAAVFHLANAIERGDHTYD